MGARGLRRVGKRSATSSSVQTLVNVDWEERIDAEAHAVGIDAVSVAGNKARVRVRLVANQRRGIDCVGRMGGGQIRPSAQIPC